MWTEQMPDSHLTSAKALSGEQLEFGQANQLREPATKRFTIGIERPTHASSRQLVADLIVDGQKFAGPLDLIAWPPRAALKVAGR